MFCFSQVSRGYQAVLQHIAGDREAGTKGGWNGVKRPHGFIFEHVPPICCGKTARLHAFHSKFTARCFVSVTDPVQGESTMDRYYSLHFPRLLSGTPKIHPKQTEILKICFSDPSFRHHELRFRGSVLLDPCHIGLKQGYADGIGYFAHRDVWTYHAATGRGEDH